jgi:hypothetical protein
MELADQGYRNSLRSLGNAPGPDAGEITVKLTDGTAVTVATKDTTVLGELGLRTRLPDGRGAFYFASNVVSIEDAVNPQPCPAPPPPAELDQPGGT